MILLFEYLAYFRIFEYSFSSLIIMSLPKQPWIYFGQSVEQDQPAYMAHLLN